jgi:hypothetical protein
MFIDALLKVATAQAMGAAAVSASSIDLGLTTPGRQIGTGEAMGFGINVDVGATVAATLIEVISATDAALTAGIISHVSETVPLATAVAGFQLFLPIPQGTPTQRFLGVRTTTAGGTISISAWLTTHSLFSLIQRYYPKNYVV